MPIHAFGRGGCYKFEGLLTTVTTSEGARSLLKLRLATCFEIFAAINSGPPQPLAMNPTDDQQVSESRALKPCFRKP